MADHEKDYEQEELTREEARRRIVRQTRESGIYDNPAFLERERLRRRDRRRDVLITVSVCAVLLLFALFWFRNYSYTTYSLDTESAFGALSGTQVRQLASGNVIIGGDTITYMEEGRVIWTTAVDIRRPVIAVNGDFFSVYDTGGYQVYVCDTTGILCTLQLSRVIYGMDISETGVVAVVTESDESAYISWFDRYGSRIPVEVKAVLSATGIPVHIAISPDSQKLMVLYYSTANGIGESRMVLYDFERGREEESYIIESDQTFYDTGTYLVDGKFLDNDHFAAVGTNLTRFYNYDSRTREVYSETLEYDKEVQSVLFGEDSFYLIEREDGTAACRVFDRSGREKNSFEVTPDYKLAAVSGQSLAFLNAADLTVYNVSGRKRYEGTLVDAPVSFAFSGRRSLLLNTGSLIEEISLK